MPDILEDNLTLEEANRLEIYYINYFHSADDKYGYNIAFGGSNSLMAEESKMIISQKAKERYKIPSNNPMFGKRHSVKCIKKMSEAKLGDKNPMYGTTWNDNQKSAIRHGWVYEWTDERRLQASKRFKNISKNWRKRVFCIEDDLIFESVTDAANYYSVSKGTLSGHLHGRQKSCAGKHFKVIAVGV